MTDELTDLDIGQVYPILEEVSDVFLQNQTALIKPTSKNRFFPSWHVISADSNLFSVNSAIKN